jgi:hypothetical protein
VKSIITRPYVLKQRVREIVAAFEEKHPQFRDSVKDPATFLAARNIIRDAVCLTYKERHGVVGDEGRGVKDYVLELVDEMR